MGVAFKTFGRWSSLMIGGQPAGYLTHDSSLGTSLHLPKDAPHWLRLVRAAGPWKSLDEGQQAVALAAVSPLARGYVSTVSRDHEREMGVSHTAVAVCMHAAGFPVMVAGTLYRFCKTWREVVRAELLADGEV